MAHDVQITAATSVDTDLVHAIHRLVKQLSASGIPPTREELEEIVKSASTTLLLARDGAQDRPIIGSLTLVVFRPTGLRAWVEDVIVDADARGRGVGEALIKHAVRIAVAPGARSVDLTSRPTRQAANRLYQRLGFTLRDTNVYRYSTNPSESV